MKIKVENIEIEIIGDVESVEYSEGKLRVTAKKQGQYVPQPYYYPTVWEKPYWTEITTSPNTVGTPYVIPNTTGLSSPSRSWYDKGNLVQDYRLGAQQNQQFAETSGSIQG